MIVAWTSPDWAYNCFPQPELNVEVVTLDYIVDALREEVDRCKEWDTTPLGRVLHVLHMLVSNQGEDGLWPATFNLRTGDEIGVARSSAAGDLMQRCNEILGSSEFDYALFRCKEGIAAQKAKQEENSIEKKSLEQSASSSVKAD